LKYAFTASIDCSVGLEIFTVRTFIFVWLPVLETSYLLPILMKMKGRVFVSHQAAPAIFPKIQKSRPNILFLSMSKLVYM